ncbi:probable transcription factor At4g00610 [Capsella rubella]|uniref:probable transcription factor At4g00610 n=1 Tax=Capsella rubella TaxID=81985 RepID=UPI000CD582ED|nr:probable transcription factor At4g00610 [Capsella rubella]
MIQLLSDSKETESRSAPAPASSHVPASSSRPPKKKRQITEVAAALTVAKRAKNVRFQRVWSEKDEIMLLQGLIEYQSKTGQSDSEDMNAFFHSIQRSISFEMKSVRQMTSKIWFLRKKYKNEKGQKRCFTEEHDLTCFELVKKIWGSEVIDSTIAEVDFTVPSD